MEISDLVIFLLLKRILDDFKDFSTNILLFNDLLEKLRDILNSLEDELISSILETFLNDFKLDAKYIASNKVVLPALFSPHMMVILLSNANLEKPMDLKFCIDKDSMCTTKHALA